MEKQRIQNTQKHYKSNKVKVRLHNGRPQTIWLGEELKEKGISHFGSETSLNKNIKSFVLSNYSLKQWSKQNQSEIVQEFLKGEIK